MACSNTSNCGCSSCQTTTCVNGQWVVTSTTSSLTPCITPNYCDTGCVETINSDCVILGSDFALCESRGGGFFMAGTSLTGMLQYLFCEEVAPFAITGTNPCSGEADVRATNGTITIVTTLTEYTFKLYKKVDGLWVLQTSISEPDLSFIDLGYGEYAVVVLDSLAKYVELVDEFDKCSA